MKSYLNKIFSLPGLLEAALDGGLDVAATESCGLAQDPGDLDAVVQQQAQLPVAGAPMLVRDQAKHVWQSDKNHIGKELKPRTNVEDFFSTFDLMELT